jgi:hypothetical protein
MPVGLGYATASFAPQWPQRSNPDSSASPLLTDPRTALPLLFVLCAIVFWLLQ